VSAGPRFAELLNCHFDARVLTHRTHVMFVRIVKALLKGQVFYGRAQSRGPKAPTFALLDPSECEAMQAP
jgi:hypothetical protein